MKSLLTITSLILLNTALAASSFNFIQGGFGTDGATLTPVPTKISVKDAAQLYKAMDVQDVDGEKFVGIVVGEDAIGLTCKKPAKGIHTQTADCEFLALASKEDSKDGITWDGEVTVRGALAKELVAKIKMKSVVRVGATTHEVANLRCVTSRNAKGLVARCTISRLNAVGMDLDQLISEGALSKKDAKELVNALGL